MGYKLSGEVLQKIVSNLTLDRAKHLAQIINTLAVRPDYKMDDKDILEEFIAQVAHESGGFRVKLENMNYSAQRLLQVFPKYFNTISAQRFAHQPEKIANVVYANRLGNGDTKSGDGWKYRGFSFMQLTGKDTAKAYSKFKGSEDYDYNAELCRTNDYWAMDAAFWFFAVYKKLIPLAVADDNLTITKRVNGGLNGFLDREQYLKRCKLYM